MIASTERRFILFSLTLAIVTVFGFSVFFTPDALSGQKGKSKSYSKSWKHKTNQGAWKHNGSKRYGKQQGHSSKYVNGKHGGISKQNGGKDAGSVGVEQGNINSTANQKQAERQYKDKKQNDLKALNKDNGQYRAESEREIYQYNQQNLEKPNLIDANTTEQAE